MTVTDVLPKDAIPSIDDPTFGERYFGERDDEVVVVDGDPREWNRDDVDPKTLVLGVEDGDDAMCYPRPRVRAAGGVVTDRVGSREVAVFAADGSLYAYENDGYAFERVHEGETTFRTDEAIWDPLTGEIEDGRSLTRLPARALFAFAWQDDHGPDAFYEP